MKYAILMQHGVDLHSCPGTLADVQDRVESMPCASSTKTQPDSRGLVPGIHVFLPLIYKDVDGRRKPGHGLWPRANPFGFTRVRQYQCPSQQRPTWTGRQHALLQRGFDLGNAGQNAGFVLFTAWGT